MKRPQRTQQPPENIFAHIFTKRSEFFSSLVHLLFLGRKEIARLKIHLSAAQQASSDGWGGVYIYLLIAA
jgi:hypothetical protein